MKLGLVVLALVLFPLVSLAAPTGLVSIPTADVLGMAAFRVDADVSSTPKLIVTDPDATVIGTQVGLVLGLEVGADQIINPEVAADKGTVFNAKWQIKGEGTVLPALAIGAQNLADGKEAQYYAVVTKSVPFKLVSGTVGVMHASGDTMLLAGAGAQFGPVRLQADTVQGGDLDRTSYSLGTNIKRIRVAGVFTNFDNGDDTFGVSASYEFGGVMSLLP